MSRPWRHATCVRLRLWRHLHPPSCNLYMGPPKYFYQQIRIFLYHKTRVHPKFLQNNFHQESKFSLLQSDLSPRFHQKFAQVSQRVRLQAQGLGSGLGPGVLEPPDTHLSHGGQACHPACHIPLHKWIRFRKWTCQFLRPPVTALALVAFWGGGVVVMR